MNFCNPKTQFTRYNLLSQLVWQPIGHLYIWYNLLSNRLSNQLWQQVVSCKRGFRVTEVHEQCHRLTEYMTSCLPVRSVCVIVMYRFRDGEFVSENCKINYAACIWRRRCEWRLLDVQDFCPRKTRVSMRHSLHGDKCRYIDTVMTCDRRKDRHRHQAYTALCMCIVW